MRRTSAHSGDTKLRSGELSIGPSQGLAAASHGASPMWTSVCQSAKTAWSAVVSCFVVPPVDTEGVASDGKTCDSAQIHAASKTAGIRESLDQRSLTSEGTRKWAANAKLTYEDAQEIRALGATGLATGAMMAREYKVSETTISRILLHKSWQTPKTKYLDKREKLCCICGKVIPDRNSEYRRVSPCSWRTRRFCDKECAHKPWLAIRKFFAQ